MSSEGPRGQTIRHILVALDGSDPSLAALDAASALAAQLDAELEALFVEDIELLRLADLPGARVISLMRLEALPVDRTRMERRLRLRAVRAHNALQRRAGAMGVRATFRSVRGEVHAEVLAASAAADLVSLGATSHIAGDPARLGSTVQAALASGHPLLITRSRPPAGRRVLAAYDGTDPARSALHLAADLALSTGRPLTVLALGGSPAEAAHMAGEAAAQLEAWSAAADILCGWPAPALALRAAGRRLRPALLVAGLPADQAQASELVAATNCPLLLVP